ncbi:MAG: DJ-1/PfpI family protein [Cyanosarcina radialis HA8281-LM2]|jgi:cyclohexyl-isocyanide hydratase|nr:DJ-1/PfpI family protein [Cyanosarcina radialis HA8281-LM2]
MSNSQPYIVGLVMYPGMTALDIVGPQTVFSSLPDVKIHRIWKAIEPIQTDDGMTIVPDTTFADCPRLDVICIGGGLGQMAVEDDPEVLEFLGRQGSTAKFVTSVCGGSVFLAKAGLLQGYRAATHWAMRSELAKLGVEVGTERVTIDRNRMSGGGVTAGIDFGLAIAEKLRGEEAAKLAQLMMEYDPAPPFDAGSPEKAGPELVQKAMSFAAQNLGLAV